jgi:hypothetical protein
MLTIVFTAIVFFTATNPNRSFMSMNYDIIPNKQTQCNDEFGEGLSFLFEQVGGYGNKAEVEQVSKVLQLDLSIFQDVEYSYEDKKGIEKHWHSIDVVYSLVDTFISKIHSHPDYYKQVYHNPNRNGQLKEQQRIWEITDTAERDKQLELLYKQPYYFYPPDYGYLSSGGLLKGLTTLKKTLDCYRKNGVTKIRFEYN